MTTADTNNAVVQTNRQRRRLFFPVMLILTGLVGCVVGLGSFTFIYAKGSSYLTDDPAACANCHIMREVYTAWERGSHRNVAGCNDCHTPHDNIVSKYLVKAINGFNHSVAFTTGNFPYPLRITEMNHEVALHNCQTCHSSLTSMISHTGYVKPVDCLQCHATVGHDQ